MFTKHWSEKQNGSWIIIAVIAFSLLLACIAKANIILSTKDSATLGGISIENYQLADYDTTSDLATLFTSINLDKNIDAFHKLENGNVVFSFAGGGTITLGGLTFDKSDLVVYDPVSDIASMLLDGDTHSNTDVSSVYVRDSGNIIFSTTSDTSIGGISFSRDDLIEYNPATDTATMIFEGETLFLEDDEKIDAVHILDNGNIVLSTDRSATLGGLAFDKGDLVEYNLASQTATLYLSGNVFCGDENINAVYITSSEIPEPATICLLGIGSLIFIRRSYGMRIC